MSWEYIASYETLKNLGISIGIFMLFILFRKIFIKDIFDIILKLSKKTPTDFLYYVCLAFEHPAHWLFVIIGLYVALGFFPFVEQSNPLILRLIRASIIALFSWGFLNLSSASSQVFTKLKERYDLKFDQLLIPFLSKALQFIIIAISISVIAQEFGYDVNGFVAGLGLGGLAFALAAKDAIANLFGGIVIITERPFSIGDWIMTPSIDGTVEDINFRSTKVRTFDQALVTVPNATLANQAIKNWSKMGKRQISFRLGLTYDTPKDKLERTVQRIDALLKDHPDIHPETIIVTFDQYNESSLDIFLYFFTKTTSYQDYMKVKEDINFRIFDIIEEEGVSFAFPSRTLYIDSQVDTAFQKDFPLKEENPS